MAGEMVVLGEENCKILCGDLGRVEKAECPAGPGPVCEEGRQALQGRLPPRSCFLPSGQRLPAQKSKMMRFEIPLADHRRSAAREGRVRGWRLS